MTTILSKANANSSSDNQRRATRRLLSNSATGAQTPPRRCCWWDCVRLTMNSSERLATTNDGHEDTSRCGEPCCITQSIGRRSLAQTGNTTQWSNTISVDDHPVFERNKEKQTHKMNWNSSVIIRQKSWITWSQLLNRHRGKTSTQRSW